MLIQPRSRRSRFHAHNAPTAPVAIADEVELYARESGRHARLLWVPGMNAWEARFTLRETDPIKRLMQAGGEEQFESVYFQEPNPNFGKPGEFPYRSLNIEQMGPSGVRQFLERGNTWSGRGEFKSHTEAVTKAAEQGREFREQKRKSARQNALDIAAEVRRQVNKIPFFRTGIALNKES